MMAILLVVIGLVFAPTLVAALAVSMFQMMWCLMKFAFTFWQVVLFLLFIIFIANALG